MLPILLAAFDSVALLLCGCRITAHHQCHALRRMFELMVVWLTAQGTAQYLECVYHTNDDTIYRIWLKKKILGVLKNILKPTAKPLYKNLCPTSFFFRQNSLSRFCITSVKPSAMNKNKKLLPPVSFTCLAVVSSCTNETCAHSFSLMRFIWCILRTTDQEET